MPRWLVYAAIVAVFASFVPLALIARQRTIKADRTRIQPVQDMGDQPKFKPQSANPLFADGRAMRPPVDGTVAFGGALLPPAVETGRGPDGRFLDALPIPLTPASIRRGQRQFNIYCAPCHGLAGYGDGLVARRADQLQEGTWVPPTSLHTDQVKARPNGHLFNTIGRGIRSMPSYGSQIAVDDRWAIVAYVRALQVSQGGPPPGTGRAGSSARPAPTVAAVAAESGR